MFAHAYADSLVLLFPASRAQRHYIRILWMVPIYSIESFLALRFKGQKEYLETMREYNGVCAQPRCIRGLR